MGLRAIAGLAIAGGVLLACRGTLPTQSVTMGGAGVANSGTCNWTPAGTVLIPVDEQQTFFPDQGGCTGYTITITTGAAPYGFTQGTDCDLKSVVTSGSTLFKIRACEAGTGTVTIKSGGVTVQTILLDNAL